MGAVWVLRAVISLELLEAQMRNVVIIPDDCRRRQRLHSRVCLESKRKSRCVKSTPSVIKSPVENESLCSGPKLNRHI